MDGTSFCTSVTTSNLSRRQRLALILDSISSTSNAARVESTNFFVYMKNESPVPYLDGGCRLSTDGDHCFLQTE